MSNFDYQRLKILFNRLGASWKGSVLMQLSHSHRFIFIHIFKTAGTSIRAVLENYTNPPERQLWNRLWHRLGYPFPRLYPGLSDHARAVEIRDVLPSDVFNSYYKFAFVRNPWDWQVSWYHYILQNTEHHEHAAVVSLGCFEEFLRWRIDHPVWSQKDFVVDNQGEEIVDFIGCFENLRADFDRVCLATSVRERLPHLNRSRHNDYRTYYNDRTSALLEEYSKEDIDYFGYQFEEPKERHILPLVRPFRASIEERAA